MEIRGSPTRSSGADNLVLLLAPRKAKQDYAWLLEENLHLKIIEHEAERLARKIRTSTLDVRQSRKALSVQRRRRGSSGVLASQWYRVEDAARKYGVSRVP